MKLWRGLKALVHDAVDVTVDLVQEGHESAARTAMRVLEQIEPLAGPARVVNEIRRVSTAGVLASVRVVNRAVQQVTDVGLDAAEHLAHEFAEPRREDDADARDGGVATAVPMRSDVIGTLGWVGDAALGAINGVVGDHLHARENGLDLGLSFRYGDGEVPLDAAGLRRAIPDATSKLCVFVHGLGATEWSWCLNAAEYHGDAGANFGTLLHRDLGYTPVFARYNTGRHVSHNGRLLAERLDALLAAYPVPVDELILIGHSMGGLVVRAACAVAHADGRAWLARLSRVFCLGAPHQGAVLEKVGNVAAAVLGAFDLPGTRIPARILNGRSAGIKDLRFGYVVDEEWLDQDPDALLANNRRKVPLLDGVGYYFISATLTRDPAHPLGRLVGDLLVRVPSASELGTRHGEFQIATQCFGGVMHHQLQNHPDVYAQIRRACAGETDGATAVGSS
jgi:triacylglycerol lipase